MKGKISGFSSVLRSSAIRLRKVTEPFFRERLPFERDGVSRAADCKQLLDIFDRQFGAASRLKRRPVDADDAVDEKLHCFAQRNQVEGCQSKGRTKKEPRSPLRRFESRAFLMQCRTKEHLSRPIGSLAG